MANNTITRLEFNDVPSSWEPDLRVAALVATLINGPLMIDVSSAAS